jgi:hypothetical protein
VYAASQQYFCGERHFNPRFNFLSFSGKLVTIADKPAWLQRLPHVRPVAPAAAILN